MFGASAFGVPYFGGSRTIGHALVSAATITIAVASPPNLSAQSRLDAVAGFSFSTQSAFIAPIRLVAVPSFSFRTTVDLLTPSRADVTAITIRLGGVDVTNRVKIGSLSIHDAINHEVNTARMLFLKAPPVAPQPLEIYINKITPRLLFNGTLDHVDLSYQAGKPKNLAWPASAIDDGARAAKRLPFGSWSNVSATTVATVLVANFAPGFTATHVEGGLPTITLTLNGTEGMNGALAQIAKLIGGYYYWELKDLHLFRSEPGELPDPIDAAHQFLNDPPITKTLDVTQIRTRVYGRGHGENVIADVAAGETIVPLADSTMFNPLGGRVVVESQRLAYTGVQTGDGGGLVGPGASPSAAPVAGLAPGTGIETGVHKYGITYLTAAGESAVGPLATINVGPVAPPDGGPNAGSVSAGGAVDAGIHNYAASFVTATGETVVGIEGVGATTGGVAAAPPANAPTAGAATSGGSVPVGTHYHAVSFVGPTGESALGPWSNGSTTSASSGLGTPSRPTNFATVGGGTEIDCTAGNYFYYVATHVTAKGETTAASIGNFARIESVGTPQQPMLTEQTAGNMPAGTYRYKFTWVTAGGESLPSSEQVKFINGTTYKGIYVQAVSASPDARVTARRIYRSVDGGAFALLVTINDNVTTTYQDTAATASGSPPPGTDTTAKGRIQMTVFTGDASVTARKIYRGNNVGGPFWLVGTIGNNSATTFVDNVPNNNTSNPSPPPTDGTGYSNQTIPLSGIQTGPSGTTARKLYRSFSQGGGNLVATIANNSSTSYNDTAAAGGAAAPSGSTLNTINVVNIPIGSPVVTARKLYRRSGGVGLRLVATIADNVTTIYTDTIANASLGVGPLQAGTATANRVLVSSIQIGGVGVTGRKLYRTQANGAQLYNAATLDNVATSFLDTTADQFLGNFAPSSDTSGLIQPNGQIAAGAPTVIVASTASFTPSGGWAVVGNGQQVIRYTGLTGTALTGVPATGPGAIVAAISYNSTITPAPTLVGVSGLSLPLLKGVSVNIFVQRDDVAAQNELAVLAGDRTTTNVGTTCPAAASWIGIGVTLNPSGVTAYDHVISGGFDTSAPSRTIAYTSPARASSYYLAFVTGGQSDYITGATYNSLPMTLLGKANGTTVGLGWIYLFGIANSNSGSHTVKVSASSPNFIGITAAMYQNVSNVQPDSEVGTGSGPATAFAIPLAPNAPNCWGVTFMRNSQGSVYNPATGALRYYQQTDGLATVIDSNGALPFPTEAGVVEHLITDERRGETSLIALCDADLKLYSRPIVTVRYATRDPKTKTGRPIVINLATPAIHETLTIQAVDIDQIDMSERGINPRFTVTASTVRFSVEDVLRRLTGGLGGL
jgi:hypothetical protein